MQTLTGRIGRFFHYVLFVALSSFCIAAAVAADDNPGYTKLGTPQPTDHPGKIEVIEFFSYTCPHCYELNPVIKKWAAAQPDDVVFKRVAIPGSLAWTNTARLFYALEATGELDKLDDAIFQALHREGKRFITDERNMAAWVKSQGGDAAKFSAAYNSFGVNARMQNADRLAKTYNVEGVPLIAVNGTYLVQLESFDKTLKTVDMLIENIRQQSKN